jgi:hypothetical protein
MSEISDNIQLNRSLLKKGICAMRILLSIMLFFSFYGVSNAYNQSTIDKFSSQLNEQANVIDKAEENVFQMLEGVTAERQQYNWGMLAYKNSTKFNDAVGALLITSYIYVGMIDNRDKKYAEKFLGLECQTTIKRGQKSIANINSYLPSIESTALVNEITKMRDAIAAAMQLLEICKS